MFNRTYLNCGLGLQPESQNFLFNIFSVSNIVIQSVIYLQVSLSIFHTHSVKKFLYKMYMTTESYNRLNLDYLNPYWIQDTKIDGLGVTFFRSLYYFCKKADQECWGSSGEGTSSPVVAGRCSNTSPNLPLLKCFSLAAAGPELPGEAAQWLFLLLHGRNSQYNEFLCCCTELLSWFAGSWDRCQNRFCFFMFSCIVEHRCIFILIYFTV